MAMAKGGLPMPKRLFTRTADLRRIRRSAAPVLYDATPKMIAALLTAAPTAGILLWLLFG
jgi:hypothetical protein